VELQIKSKSASGVSFMSQVQVFNPSFHFNPFESVVDMCRKLRIPQSKFAQGWRLITPAKVGEVQGLPESRGMVVATDGIMAVLITGEESNNELKEQSFKLVHLKWFVKDTTNEEVDDFNETISPSGAFSKTTVKKRLEVLDGLLNDLS
jgi:hypothetical protein